MAARMSANFGRSHIELGEQFDLPASNNRVNMQFARDGDEILLQYLQRNHARSAAPVFRQKVEGASLLCRCRPVVRVNQNIGVEEATSAHESHFDRSAILENDPDLRDV